MFVFILTTYQMLTDAEGIPNRAKKTNTFRIKKSRNVFFQLHSSLICLFNSYQSFIILIIDSINSNILFSISNNNLQYLLQQEHAVYS